MKRLRLAPLSCVALLLAVPVSPGCLCVGDENFNPFLDAGQPDAGPQEIPPVFPLREGDEVVFPGIGGRVEPCNGSEGSCERTLRATYIVNDVRLDATTNTWLVDADYTYELDVANIEVGAMGQLFLSGVAPFADIDVGGAEAGDATFRTRDAPTDALAANGFPFFHFEEQYATQSDSAFSQASSAFIERILEIDSEANIENQAAEAKIEAYFKDELGVNAMLHKIRVDYHPFGFVCGWDERLATWSDGMQRRETDFTGLTTPLTAVFANPVQLLRDGVRYNCVCSTRTCYDRTDQSMCLDPSDPEAPPLPCECLASDPDPTVCD